MKREDLIGQEFMGWQGWRGEKMQIDATCIYRVTKTGYITDAINGYKYHCRNKTYSELFMEYVNEGRLVPLIKELT